MKSFLLLILVLLTSGYTISQTFTTQDFNEGIMPPTGWSIIGHSNQWSINMVNVAGGSTPEAKFSYINAVGITRLLSPQIDLSGYSSIVLKFKHYLIDFIGADYSIGVATRSGGGSWNTAWSINPTNNIGPEELYITIENNDVGAADFQFCIFIDGDLYNLNNWFIDNILLFSPYNLDCQMNTITSNPFVVEPTIVEGTICNMGLSPISSVDISWRVADGPVHSSSFSGLNLELGDKYTFESSELFDFTKGTYDLNVWISDVNGGDDDNQDNDLLVKNMSVVSNIVYRRPMLEEFADSYSQNAAWANNYFNPWCEERADSLTMFKYPWRYSSPDPYYTQECKEREMFYEIKNWDDVYLFGNGVETDISDVYYLNQFFSAVKQEPGFAKIVASRSSVSRNTVMDIDVAILPFANFNNHRLLISVFENSTTANVGDNGETEFIHVLMKMVPDAYGTEILLSDREPITISQSIDLAGTYIEEWDDLGVAIFIQDFDTKEVFQSTYAIENASFASYATLIELYYNGVPVSGFSPDIYNYNIELPLGTTVIPEVTGVPADENGTVIVVPANELPGTTTIEVFAEDLTTKLMYSINFTVITGFEDIAANKVKVYPNPTKGIFNVEGVVNAKISVYTTSGVLICKFHNSNGQIIDMYNYSNGIYIVRIEEKDFVSTKRIVLDR